MNVPSFLAVTRRRVHSELSSDTLRALALEQGLGVASITTADQFTGLAGHLERHIDAGFINGLEWFTRERARFSVSPGNLLPTARSIVSVGVPYWSGSAEKPRDVPRGRISRYAWGADYHVVLKQRMLGLRNAIERVVGHSIEARCLVDTARIVDRAVAARSGLGWYGKHSCIIVPGHGSWVMLGDLVLDIDLEPDEPLNRDCGRCSICLDQCPTGAIVAPYTIDTPKCLSFQTIEQRGAIPLALRSLLADWVFGCDVCQDVCPYTGAARIQDDPSFRPANEMSQFPPLARLLELSEAEFRHTYRGSAVLRTKRRGLARNAAVALGNIGSPDDLPVLARALAQHDEPLVRGHAAWAIGAIGGSSAMDTLRAAIVLETEQSVLIEIESAINRLAASL